MATHFPYCVRIFFGQIVQILSETRTKLGRVSFSLRAGSLVGRVSWAKELARGMGPHSSRRVRRFSVLCPLPKQVSLLAGYVSLGSIRNKNYWNNASKRLFGAILILEYLDFHSGYSSPRSRIAGIYFGIYFYSGISQTNAPLKTTAVVIFETRKIYAK